MSDKQDARKLSPQAQEDLRRRVVRAIVEGGMKQVEAARVFGVGRTSIHHWLRAYEEGGDAALKARKRGPRRISRLKGHQAATIVNMLEQKHPEQLQLPFTLWTREAVGNVIRQRFGIDVSVWTVGRYLKPYPGTSSILFGPWDCGEVVYHERSS